MQDFKNISTNWLAIVIVVFYALNVYFTNIQNGEQFDWMKMVIYVVAAVLSYLCGKGPNGKKYTTEQLTALQPPPVKPEEKKS